MNILNLTQGTQEWLDVRLSHFTASEAPAMMNCSKHLSRNQLLDHKKGWLKEVDEYTLKRFQAGHEAENSARYFVCDQLFTELVPLVGSLEVEGLPLLASFDGINSDRSIVWEHKLFNKTLYENVLNKVLEPEYYWQLEHQILVSGANKVVFTCSDGTEDNMVSMEYVSVPERRAALIAGWQQFAKDLASHEVKAKVEKVVANELVTLPKLEVSLTGSVNASNLAEYKQTAISFIQSINTDLQTDQQFADAESTVKFLTKAEKELDSVKQKALEDTADIKALFDTIDELKEEMRQKRLTLSKLVKAEKEAIKSNLINEAKTKLNAEIMALTTEFNGVVISINADFETAVKSKRTIESLQNAVDSELARCRIELSDKATTVRANIKVLNELAGNHQFLFNDSNELVLNKATDDLTNLINARIAQYETEETARKQQDQERIEREAMEKAEREAQAKLEAERIAQIKANDAELKQREARQAEQAELNHKVMEAAQAKAKVTPVNEPNDKDIRTFLLTVNDSVINDFGYLLLSNDKRFEDEALSKIKSAFQQFMQRKAA